MSVLALQDFQVKNSPLYYPAIHVSTANKSIKPFKFVCQTSAHQLSQQTNANKPSPSIATNKILSAVAKYQY